MVDRAVFEKRTPPENLESGCSEIMGKIPSKFSIIILPPKFVKVEKLKLLDLKKLKKKKVVPILEKFRME